MNSLPLFDAFPELAGKIPHVPLASLPTPIEPLEPLSQNTGARLYVKRDDLTSPRYGGNKVRKLEFLLGRAVHDGAKAVLTFGAAGSNHALATAIYARALGLRSLSMLVPQPVAHSVRKNLLFGWKTGAELHHYTSNARVRLGVLYQMQRGRLRDGRYPQIIPAGGSSPLGALGFVNAAFELKAQIDAGLLPEPDLLFAASGTMGTVVGLYLGLKAAGLRTRVAAIRVTSPPYTSMEKARELFGATNALLHTASAAFPLLPFLESDFQLRNDFLGPGYGRYTEASAKAVRRAADGGLTLEGTYTGKAFAALLDAADSGALQGKTALFWDTYNSRDFSSEIAGIDYHALPKAFHRYFEDEVQPLDQQ